MNMTLQSARHLPGSFDLNFPGTCFQQSLMDLAPSLKKTSPHLTSSMPVTGDLLESNQHTMTVASTPTSAMLDPTEIWTGVLSAMNLTSVVKIVRKLDLLQLCFSLNFYFLIFPLQFPSMFSFLN